MSPTTAKGDESIQPCSELSTLKKQKMASATTTFIVSLPKCAHYSDTKLIGTYKGTWTLKEVFEEIHPECEKLDIVECKGFMGSGPGPGGVPIGEGITIDWVTPLEALKGYR